MRGRHSDSGRDFRPGSLPPAQAFGTEAWNVAHSGAVFIPAPPARRPDRVRDGVRRGASRARSQLVPWLVLPLPPIAAQSAAELHDEIAVLVISTAAVILILAARRPALLTAIRCALAAAWICWASAAGLRHTWAMPALVAGWAICSLGWWDRNRARHAHGGDEPPPDEPDAQDPDELLTRLRNRVCAPGQRLSGALVTPDTETMKGGRAFLFALDPGRQSFEDVRQAALSIASAAEVPRSRVVAEAAPSDIPGEDGPAHLARVIILERQNVHREIQEFTGMTLVRDTGLFDVGPYPDHEQAPCRLYKVDEKGNPMRAASGLTSGAPGSGKSRYVEHKLVEHLMSGLFKVFLLDGQGGASIPGLLDHVDWPATRAGEWDTCLRAVVRLMIARTRKQSARRLPCWYATPEDPFVQVIIEEAHKPLRGPVIMRMVKSLLQEGEKVGIGLDLVTQFPSQAELGASSGTNGANVIRSMAAAGNVVLFRTGDGDSKGMAVGQVEVNPRLLPQRPGMCHPLGASMRLAPARAIRVAEPASWGASAPVTTFSPLDLAALGADYEARWERFAKFDAEPGADTLDKDELETELRLITGEEAPAAEDGRTPAAKGTTVIQACWQILSKDGTAKRDQLITAIGCSPSAVDQALKALEKTGRIRKGSGHGVWELDRTLRPVTDELKEAAGG